jgi:hypothetical protein
MSDLLVITNTFVNGTPADGTEVNANFDDVKQYIDARFGNAASAQIWVANASGVATPRTVSGDATISNTGVLTVGAGKITDSQLASPVSPAWKTIHVARGLTRPLQGTALSVLMVYGPMQADPRDMLTTSDGTNLVDAIRLVEADHAIAGKTTKMRLRSDASVNNTAPGVNFVVQLFGSSAAGAADTVRLTAGAAQGEAVTHTAPGTGHNTATGAEFTMPATGFYLVTVTPSAQVAANSAVLFTVQLQIRHV